MTSLAPLATAASWPPSSSPCSRSPPARRSPRSTRSRAATPTRRASTSPTVRCRARSSTSTRRAAPRPPAGWPVVVFFYGGSWTTGDRGDYKFVGEALAERGIARVVADYRLYPKCAIPTSCRTARSPLAWSLEHAQRARRRPEARLRDGPQRRRLQRGDAGARPALARADRPRAAELAGWIGLAGAVRLPAARAGLAGAAGVPPSRLPAEHAADRRRARRVAARLPRRACRRQGREPAAQHAGDGREAEGAPACRSS